MSVSYRLIAVNELDSTLLEAWRSIQRSSDSFHSPYFCPEFTQLVAAVRGDVRVVVIENGGRPVGFFPHQRSLLGMGRPVGGALSDYHGVITERAAEWRVCELLSAARLAVWTFDHLVDETGRFAPHVTGRDVSPQADLSAGYERYVQARRDAGTDEITQAERKGRKLAREAGELRFTLHEAGNAAMDQLIAWKREQYRRTRLPDAFGVPWTGELLRRIAAQQTPEFAGVCSVLRLGDRIIAAHMGMRSRSVFHHWFPAYDPQLARFSPGSLLLLRTAQALAGSGVRTIDFGKGGLHWKRSFMSRAAEVREGFVELSSLLAAARRHLPLRAVRRLEHGLRFR